MRSESSGEAAELQRWKIGEPQDPSSTASIWLNWWRIFETSSGTYIDMKVSRIKECAFGSREEERGFRGGRRVGLMITFL